MWDSVHYIGIDNSNPPQLWAWCGDVGDESSEAMFPCPGEWLVRFIQQLREENATLRKEIRRLNRSIASAALICKTE